MSPVRGPDGTWYTPAVEHDHQPIVPKAKWIVRCDACGYTRDSAQAIEALVVAEFTEDHPHKDAGITMTPVDYSAHPLHHGRR